MNQPTSSWRSYLLAAVVALGLSIVWAVVVAIGVGMTQSVGGERLYEQIYVGLDGEPYILRNSLGVYVPVQDVLTLSGEPAPVGTGSLLMPQYISRQPAEAGLISGAWRTRLAAVNNGATPAQYWYLVHDGRAGGRAYGIGFDALSKRVVGYFGRKGFSDRKPSRAEWFQPPGNMGLYGTTPNVAQWEPQWGDGHVLYLLADGKLWAADTQAKQVRSLVDIPGEATLGWARDLSRNDSRPKPTNASQTGSAWAPEVLLVRTDEACMLVDPLTGQAETYKLPANLRSASLAAFHLAERNLLLVALGDPFVPAGSQVVWLSPQGEVTRKQTVRLAQGGAVEMGASAVGWLAAAAAPFPAGQFPTLGLMPWEMVATGRFESYGAAIAWMIRQTWPSLLAVLGMGAVGAVAAYRRQQHYGLSGALGWAIFAFLFGVPGWIAYRWHRTWPVLGDCPACGRVVPQDRESCTECLTDFPPPARKGIEVFA